MTDLEPEPESQPRQPVCGVDDSAHQDWSQHMPEQWAQEIDESEVSFGGGGNQHRVTLKLSVVRPAAILAECNHANKAGSGAVNATDTTGLVSWGLSTTLSAYAVARRQLVVGKRVLELGCGRGMCGLVAAQCGAAKVVLSDYEPAVLALAQKNVAANAAAHAASAGAAQPSVERLVWSRSPAEQRSCGLFDLLLGSELLYHETDIAALIASAEHHLAKDGVVVLVYRARVWGITSNLQIAAQAQGMSLQFVDIQSICNEDARGQLSGSYCAFLSRDSDAEHALAPWLAGLRLVEATDEDNGEDVGDSEVDSDGDTMQGLFGD